MPSKEIFISEGKVDRKQTLRIRNSGAKIMYSYSFYHVIFFSFNGIFQFFFHLVQTILEKESNYFPSQNYVIKGVEM